MNGERLSEAGERRRAAMLVAMQRQVAARGRRRVAARAAVGLAAALVIVAGGVAAMRMMSVPVGVAEPGPAMAEARREPAESPASPEREEAPAVVVDAARELDMVPRVSPGVVALVTRAEADGSMVRRVRSSGEVRVAGASDESLAAGLRAAGVGAGVARVGERVMVVRDRGAGEG